MDVRDEFLACIGAGAEPRASPAIRAVVSELATPASP
jgi:hypothetical protein